MKEELVGPLDGFQDQKTKEETFDVFDAAVIKS